MRKIYFLIFLLCSNVAGFSQNFAGYNTGNYTGVNGVFFNPANIADSRYRWDFNLVGIHAGISNNVVKFTLNDLTGDKLGDKVDSAFFGQGTKPASLLANVDILGPSVMFNVGKKMGIALTTRVRTMANVKDLDGNLFRTIKDNVADDDLPLKLSSNQNQRINFNAWGEFGLSIARELYSQDAHFLKAGISLKYLAGVSNYYVDISKFSGWANKDAIGNYIYDASGSLAIGMSGVNPDDFEASDLTKFKTTGFGADIGLIYEHRPVNSTGQSSNRYKYKIGVALLDLGKIQYTLIPDNSASYSVNIPAVDKWHPNELEDSSLDGVKKYFDNNPQFFTNNAPAGNKYKVAMPTSFLVNLDYNLYKGFYVALVAHLDATVKSSYGSNIYNSITLTPRYEGKAFGIYLPVNNNQLSGTNVGLSLRLGPLFVGSGSIISSALGDSKQADVHFGLRFGSLKKHSVQKAIVPSDKTPVVKKKKKAVEPKPSEPKKEEAVFVAPKIVVTDTDADGIVDSTDKCPTIAGLAKYNGCPIPDTDGDGINDEMDSCINVPGLVKYNGCPVPDTDGDGINDELDKCVTVPGVEKYGGCPIPDSDNDGVNDENDKCVTVPGSPKYNGCPIPDSDNDGLNDEEDKCPNLAGVKSNYGCPEIKKDIVKKVTIAAKGLRFQTGKAIILKSSYVQLNNVVKILKDNPALLIKIEGHTDNVGTEEKNMLLSTNRANATKDYFVKKGIDASRITTEGFGPTKPIAPNTTSAGRLKNRRVEFIISN